MIRLKRRFRSCRHPYSRSFHQKESFIVKVVNTNEEDYQLYKQMLSTIIKPYRLDEYYKEDQAVYFYLAGHKSTKWNSCHQLHIKSPKDKFYCCVTSLNWEPHPKFVSFSLEKLLEFRYNNETNHLHASNLSDDLHMKWQRSKVVLSNGFHMQEVIDIIVTEFPNVCSLDLSSNRLSHLGGLMHLVTSTPKLKKLNISENEVFSFNELDKISGWYLEELVIDTPSGTPINECVEFLNAIRILFPCLQKLNNTNLPQNVPKVLVPLPQKNSSHVNEAVRGIITDLISKYLSCYNDRDMTSLKQFYDENCLFSYQCDDVLPIVAQDKFQLLEPASYNIKRIYGAEDVICFLRHQASVEQVDKDFELDMMVVTPQIVSFAYSCSCMRILLHGLGCRDEYNDPMLKQTSHIVCRVVDNSKIKIINEIVTKKKVKIKFSSEFFPSNKDITDLAENLKIT